MSDCPHEVVDVTASIDQVTMTLYSVKATCVACQAEAVALDDEVILGPWSDEDA